MDLQSCCLAAPTRDSGRYDAPEIRPDDRQPLLETAHREHSDRKRSDASCRRRTTEHEIEPRRVWGWVLETSARLAGVGIGCINPRTTLGFGEAHILLGGGGRIAPCDLPNYWADFQNSNAIR